MQYPIQDIQRLDCFDKTLTKSKAEEVLTGKPDGTYLIRESSVNAEIIDHEKDDSHYFAISYVQQGKTEHWLIRVRPDVSLYEKEKPAAPVKYNASEVSSIEDFLNTHSGKFKTPLNLKEPEKINSNRM